MANDWSEFVVITPEADIGGVMAHLNSLDARFGDLEKYDGAIKLTFSAPAANMHGFEEWLRRATKGSGKYYRNLH